MSTIKIPADKAIIPREKLTAYLLVYKPKNDKSKYLAQAGFTPHNPDALEAAIRRILKQNEAIADREDEYGIFYQVRGNLEGPDGILDTVTIWIWQDTNQQYRFVTLKPAREK